MYKDLWQNAKAFNTILEQDEKSGNTSYIGDSHRSLLRYQDEFDSCLDEAKINLGRLREVITGLPITINLNFSDESLIKAFEVFLAGVRSAMGFPTGKMREINEKAFAKWKELKILALFDLELWASIKGIKFSDALLAQVLWPVEEQNDDKTFDPVERLRKTARPKMNEIMDWFTFERLADAVELDNSATAFAKEKRKKT